VTDIQSSSHSALGYERDPELRARFGASAQNLRVVHGLPDRDHDGERRLIADLALEGGGIKGIGMVGAMRSRARRSHCGARGPGVSASSSNATA